MTQEKPSKRIQEIFLEMITKAGVTEDTQCTLEEITKFHFISMVRYLDEQWEKENLS